MLIGISGKANTGKDTICKLLQEMYPEKFFQNRKFSKKVYEIVSILTKIPVEELMKRENKESLEVPSTWWYFINDLKFKFPYNEFKGSKLVEDCTLVKPKVREVLQTIGTDIFRSYNSNIWVDLLLEDYNPNKHNEIITDVRFDNEAAAIRKLGGLVIKIESDRATPSKHISEKGISDEYVTHTIINNKETSLKDLKEQLWKILKK